MKYRFIGTLAEFGGEKLEYFGQPVQLDEATAKHPRGPAVIPAETFEAIGFSEEELNKYRLPGPRTEATPEFQAKYRAAIAARADYVNGAN